MSDIQAKIEEGKGLYSRAEAIRLELMDSAAKAGWDLIKLARQAWNETFPNEKPWHSRDSNCEWLNYCDIIELSEDLDVTFTEYGRCGDTDTTHRYISYAAICTPELREQYVNNLKLHWYNKQAEKQRDEAQHKARQIADLEARLAALKGE